MAPIDSPAVPLVLRAEIRSGGHGGESQGGGDASGGSSDLPMVSGGPIGGQTGTASSAGGATSNQCWDPKGANGLGCSMCAPTDIVGFEQACTTATCIPFDNSKRLRKLGELGQLPSLPNLATTDASSGGASFVGTAAGGGPSESSEVSTSGGTSGATTNSTVPGCDELDGKVILLTGSSAARPYLQQIAQQLSTEKVFLVYVSSGSCSGVDAIVNRTPVRTVATYWDGPASAGKSCRIPAEGWSADLGISDVFVQTCPGFELASLEAQQVKDAHGPIQTMAFVTPTTSRYGEISAQAAYFVFGFGAEGQVYDPMGAVPIWNDESQIFIRGATSGTQALLASAVGVPTARWRGTVVGSSDDLAAALLNAAGNAESATKSLGILAADYVDSKNLRGMLRVLAFQDTHQLCAYFPDSTAGARDKRNVRDGHYPLFGPMHLLYRVDATGLPANAQNRQVTLDILGYLSGTKPLPSGVPLLGLFAQNGLVPECAMRVTRTKDGGNLTAFSPSSPCSCAFEAATGTTDCKTCKVQGDCGSNEICSLGYCEPS
ncbi:MAG: hypothetical protein QM784_21315 [Polyangiaceae bacterium]